jgi:hypothetical protein
MVLLVPDDMPLDGANTLAGDVDEMRALYKDWGEWSPRQTMSKQLTALIQILAFQSYFHFASPSTNG